MRTRRTAWTAVAVTLGALVWGAASSPAVESSFARHAMTRPTDPDRFLGAGRLTLEVTGKKVRVRWTGRVRASTTLAVLIYPTSRTRGGPEAQATKHVRLHRGRSRAATVTFHDPAVLHSYPCVTANVIDQTPAGPLHAHHVYPLGPDVVWGVCPPGGFNVKPIGSTGSHNCHRAYAPVADPSELHFSVLSAKGTSCDNALKVFSAVATWAHGSPDLGASAHPDTLGYRCQVNGVGDYAWIVRCTRGQHVIRASTAQ
jgi:hypothetical protein